MRRLTLIVITLLMFICTGCASQLKKADAALYRLDRKLMEYEQQVNELADNVDELAAPVVAVNQLIEEAEPDEHGNVTVTMSAQLVDAFDKSADVASDAKAAADKGREYARESRKAVNAIRDAIPDDGNIDWGDLLAKVAQGALGLGLMSANRES